MRTRLTTSLLGCVVLLMGNLCSPVRAQDQADSDKAAGQRLNELLSMPGLLAAIPSADLPTGPERASLFFEIGRCYYAIGDSARAAQALRYAYGLDPALEARHVETPSASADLLQAKSFVVGLSLSEKREHYAGTSKLKAAGRSLILPGWGQMYRGHRKRGLVALGAIAASGLYLAKAARDYDSAKRDYEATTVSELSLELLQEGGEIPRPFESRYEIYRSKASVANTAAILLAAVWGASVLDNLILEPNRFELRVGIGP